MTNHATQPVKVAAAHTESDIFYTAKVKITAPPKDTIRRCRFDYRQGGRRYTRTLDCEIEPKTE
ncbi:hypothetical protein [Streptomyces macrosporus]|uniref:hypothetical protein n=1 Tax=Streptomyces macrosporus TaxID=44032 RepID=UPI0031CE5E1F